MTSAVEIVTLIYSYFNSFVEQRKLASVNKGIFIISFCVLVRVLF